MALAIGFLLFLLGAVTFIGWLPATFVFLKGLVSFSLLFWGFLAFVIGYSQRQAKRDFGRAMRDEKTDEIAPDASETSS